MRFYFLFVIVFMVAHSHAAELQEVVGDDGLKKVLDSHERTLVMFYAPWCPHCQDAKPKFKEASEKLKDKTRTIVLINCDDAKNTALCNAQKIEGFPTIRLFQKGKDPANFEADFTPDAILGFIENPEAAAASGGAGQTPDPPMKHVTYIEGKEGMEKVKQVLHSMIFFYAPWCPHCQEAKPKYDKAAEELEKAKTKDRVLFAMNCDLPKNGPICTEMKVEGFPTLRYYKHGEQYAEFEDDLDTKPILKMLSNPPKEKIAITPPVEDKKEGEDKKDGEKELTDADRKPEKPEDLMQGVTYLTGTSFSDFTTKNTNTLVMYYAPWCPHCQEAKPLFKAAHDQLIAAKTDGALAAINCDLKENEAHCEKEKVEGFPTLRFYRKGKMVKDFEEAPPTTAGIVKFMTSPPIPKDEL